MTRAEFLLLAARSLAASTALAATGGVRAGGASGRAGGRDAAGRRGAGAPPPSAASPKALRLEKRTIDLELRHAWTIARNSSTRKTNVLVRLTHGGHEGFGEAAPNVRFGEDAGTVATALDLLAPRLGDDPAALERVLDRLDDVLPGNLAAKAAVDIALHDLAGRIRGVPLHRMFGADPARAPRTSFSIGIDTIPAMQEKVREAEAFPILKIKVGLRDDRAILEGIRAVTDKPLYVDANEGWRDPREAVAMIRWMQDQGVALLEQPLPAGDLDGARFIRDQVDLPIFADEAVRTVADLAPLASAFDGVNIKVQKCGGLRRARAMIAEARRLGLKVMLGCMIETSIGITAAAHLAPLVDHADLDGNLLIRNDPFRGVVVREGRLVLPTGPGLGVEGAW